MQFLSFGDRLAVAFKMWTFDALSVFAHLMRSIIAGVFGSLTAPIVIYRNQQAIIRVVK